MAKAEITLTCRDCGKRFKWTKDCYNRKEANEAEAWAEENITLCPECRKKEYIKEQ